MNLNLLKKIKQLKSKNLKMNQKFEKIHNVFDRNISNFNKSSSVPNDNQLCELIQNTLDDNKRLKMQIENFSKMSKTEDTFISKESNLKTLEENLNAMEVALHLAPITQDTSSLVEYVCTLVKGEIQNFRTMRVQNLKLNQAISLANNHISTLENEL